MRKRAKRQRSWQSANIHLLSFHNLRELLISPSFYQATTTQNMNCRKTNDVASRTKALCAQLRQLATRRKLTRIRRATCRLLAGLRIWFTIYERVVGSKRPSWGLGSDSLAAQQPALPIERWIWRRKALFWQRIFRESCLKIASSAFFNAVIRVCARGIDSLASSNGKSIVSAPPANICAGEKQTIYDISEISQRLFFLSF